MSKRPRRGVLYTNAGREKYFTPRMIELLPANSPWQRKVERPAPLPPPTPPDPSVHVEAKPVTPRKKSVKR